MLFPCPAALINKLLMLGYCEVGFVHPARLTYWMTLLSVSIMRPTNSLAEPYDSKAARHIVHFGMLIS